MECRMYFYDIRYTLYFLWRFLNVQMPEVKLKQNQETNKSPHKFANVTYFLLAILVLVPSLSV